MNPIIGDRFSNPMNSMTIQNHLHHPRRTEFKSTTLLGIPKKINPIDGAHKDSTILRRTTIPTLPSSERKLVNNIKSKTINEMVLEALMEATEVIHVGISSPKKILQHTNIRNNTGSTLLRLRNISRFFKNKTDLGKSPKWSTKKLG